MRTISEPDWKLFRQFRSVALERFCERVLKSVDAVISREPGTHHERYLEVYKIVVDGDGELANVFNDFRRSTALLQPRMMHSLRLLKDEEVAQFSPAPRDV